MITFEQMNEMLYVWSQYYSIGVYGIACGLVLGYFTWLWLLKRNAFLVNVAVIVFVLFGYFVPREFLFEKPTKNREELYNICENDFSARIEEEFLGVISYCTYESFDKVKGNFETTNK